MSSLLGGPVGRYVPDDPLVAVGVPRMHAAGAPQDPQHIAMAQALTAEALAAPLSGLTAGRGCDAAARASPKQEP